MVEAIVHRVARELTLPLSEIPDLMGYAFEGLVEAKSRFDPTRGVLFRTFASYRVRGAVIDGVRQMARLSRRAYANAKAAEAADRISEDLAYARRERGASPSVEATVGALDDALARMTLSFVLANAAQDQCPSGDPSPEESLVRAESSRSLHAALARLDDRERALVVGFYFEDTPFEQTAKKLGISKSWASRIYTRALDRLRAEMLAAEDETISASAR
jgi:RNA polymerase sigma factor FliA